MALPLVTSNLDGAQGKCDRILFIRPTIMAENYTRFPSEAEAEEAVARTRAYFAKTYPGLRAIPREDYLVLRDATWRETLTQMRRKAKAKEKASQTEGR